MTKEFDVHFELTGFMQITAKSEEEAKNKANVIINNNIKDLESILKTGLYDCNYVTEVIDLPIDKKGEISMFTVCWIEGDKDRWERHHSMSEVKSLLKKIYNNNSSYSHLEDVLILTNADQFNGIDFLIMDY